MAYSILLTDDSRLIRKSLRMAFDMTGFPIKKIYEADSGRGSIDVLSSNWVDIVFLDLNMPEVSGFEVLEYMASREELSDIPVIVVTTPINNQKIELGKKNVLAVIDKPFTPEIIRDTLNLLMEK